MENQSRIVAFLTVAFSLCLPAYAQDATGEVSAGAVSSMSTESSSEPREDVGLSAEQAAQIRQLVAAAGTAPVQADFDVAIGRAIPTTVTLSLLPLSVVGVVPQFEGHLFVLLADGRIVFVSPTTLKIVLIV